MEKQEREKLRENIVKFDRGMPPSVALALLDQIEALERDATRYRCIRTALNDPNSAEFNFFMSFEELQEGCPDLLDADVDKVIAALQAEEPSRE